MKHLFGINLANKTKKLLVALAAFILLLTPAIAMAADNSAQGSYYGTGDYSSCTEGQACPTTSPPNATFYQRHKLLLNLSLILVLSVSAFSVLRLRKKAGQTPPNPLR